MLIVSLMLLQVGGGLSAQTAGLLTLGYAIAIVAFIRTGEKLLQRFGPRKPMIWGCMIVGIAIALLLPTNLMTGTYKILAVISYTLFGLGLAFYATPSTDAALSNLPESQSGSGSGIYKWHHRWGQRLVLPYLPEFLRGSVQSTLREVCLIRSSNLPEGRTILPFAKPP